MQDVGEPKIGDSRSKECHSPGEMGLDGGEADTTARRVWTVEVVSLLGLAYVDKNEGDHH